MSEQGNQPLWVRLHIAPQTDNTIMPPTVTGLLTGETATSYILNPLLELVEDTETGEPAYLQAGMNMVNRTYVWRVQILENKPEVEHTEEPQGLGEDDGGLG